VANDEHLALLRQGTAVWNEWRGRNPDSRPDLRKAKLSKANLRSVNLSTANLEKADLSMAILRSANLRGASLYGANLSGATLSEADLSWADLGGADLSMANLRETNFYRASLYDANFSEAFLRNTIFADINLAETRGLDECEHLGPSHIDFQTLLSQDLPLSFLRGCGLPDRLIDYLPSFNGNAIDFYSCFISYSARDQVFVERLHADLQNRGVRCWFAPHDLPIGAKIWDAIDEAIRVREKLLVILSEGSIASDWVEDEVNKAYAEERERRETVLFPIRIDDTVMTTTEPWARKLRDQRNIGDFRVWEQPAEYRTSLDRLLRDLKGERSDISQLGRPELAQRISRPPRSTVSAVIREGPGQPMAPEIGLRG
jgi:uncharacterized protein YjbI with pentapeptide repeats